MTYWTPTDTGFDADTTKMLEMADKLGMRKQMEKKLQSRSLGRYAAQQRVAAGVKATPEIEEFEFTPDNRQTIASIVAYAKATGMGLQMQFLQGKDEEPAAKPTPKK